MNTSDASGAGTISRTCVSLLKARIAVGCDADFVLLDAKGTVLETIVAGKTVYEKSELS